MVEEKSKGGQAPVAPRGPRGPLQVNPPPSEQASNTGSVKSQTMYPGCLFALAW